MNHLTRNRTEWVERFGAWLTRAANGRLSLGEALMLAGYEYDKAYDASPEVTAARVLTSCGEDGSAAMAAYSADLLLRKVRSPGFRVGGQHGARG